MKNKIKIQYGKYTYCQIPIYKFYKIPKLINILNGNRGSFKERFLRLKERGIVLITTIKLI